MPETIARPDYDIGAVTTGIVHLGLGAFHRAHQAVYTDAILHRHPRWGICGVSLKTPRVIAALTPQDGLYTVLGKGVDGTSARVIGAVREMLFLGTQRDRVIARIADPAVRVVSLTVTEKGYCHDPATGRLDLAHPDIAHDLAHPEAPVSAIGVLAAGLAARREAAGGPVNVVCCDNLPHNGRTVGGIVAAYAQASRPRCWPSGSARTSRFHARWSTGSCRRRPRPTSPRPRGCSASSTPRRSSSEPYNSWVIENRFAAARPPWEDAGAEVVADVAPFETMKLRLLNGSHSTLAYLGFLSGHEFIWQASADPLLATLVERLMAEEVMPTLATPPGVDLRSYVAQLMLRFRNPALAASDAADRHGRIAEAAAATPRHGARKARGRRLDRASRAGGRRLDPLRERHRRTRQADRGVRSAGGEIRGDHRMPRAAMPRTSPTAFSISPKCSARISRPMPPFGGR